MGLLQCLGLRRRDQWQPPTLLDSLLLSPLTYLTSLFYQVVLLLRGHPFHPARPKIRVVAISDTHDQFVHIPPGDILVHAGDLTNEGTVRDIQKQIDWLKRQPHAVKVVVAGNHDSWFDPKSRRDEDVKSGAQVDLDGVVYLESQITVQEIRGRKVHIFGVPDIPNIGPPEFAFQYQPDEHPWLSKIPPETDILITHSPPKHHHDLALGDTNLLRELYRVRPRLHIFGHVHFGYGSSPAYYDDLQTAYERLMARPKRGWLRECFPCDLWWDVATVLYLGLESVAWKWLMGGPGSNRGGLMVNAAQMHGNTGKVRSRAVVIDI
ncbi:putative rhamnogalacturonate lyase C [Emericellopsis cladophorae]|uniref:Rhamnogalacturonate lyase C n=1 Tax=Emericellopsis cladophorae TaxID=2686198 RepID=A0A9P9Y8J0_9HYPO|nr:putative rhamnogalacturonate lyase C [Emericellopsis cladophorae]KAI6785441.1 putative rhamnogalacturonate lyase C [Emericellopsis cladophorae]